MTLTVVASEFDTITLDPSVLTARLQGPDPTWIAGWADLELR